MLNDKKDNPGKTLRHAGAATPDSEPWYAGRHKDAVFYLLTAVLLIELAVGGIAFFYGVIHAVPLTPGGPPMARFPWLGWAVAAVLAPVGLLLVVHLTGLWLSRALRRDQEAGGETGVLPERLQRFYAILRNTPTIVLLTGMLLLGAGLFFVDGAISGLISLGGRLLDYTHWIVGSTAALLAGCYITHRVFVYRHQRMEREYAYRREVLERTGIVLADKNCLPLPSGQNSPLILPAAGNPALPGIVDAEGAAVADASSIRRGENLRSLPAGDEAAPGQVPPGH
ncbi:MAG: hypothetical protein LBN96_04030 [Desulfovibrio sp.]|jgi:hypothetical protein|nr:hypothetical protein [Desulfovibrio sp.]